MIAILRRSTIAAALCALVVATNACPAHAQVPGVVTVPPVSAPGSVALSASSVSATATLPLSPTAYNALTIENTGSVAAYLANGGTATTGDVFLAGGAYKCLPALGLSTLSAITASGSTTLRITQSNVCIDVGGSLVIAGGGGPVTQGTTPWVDNVTTWGGGTLGAMANYGTSPGAVLVPGVNAFVTNAVAVTGTFWQATQPVSGTVAATQSTSPWVDNVTQFGGTNLSTGTGAGGAGIPRVTVSNDSVLQLWDGTNGPVAVKAASTAPVATDKAAVVDIGPNSAGIITLGQTTKAASVPVTAASDQPYPVPPTQTTAIATGTTGAVTATLAATASVTNYICTVDVSATGGTAAIGPVTITGLLGGTFTYQLFSTATGVTLSRTYMPCIPASGTNVAIAVATTADGTASAVDVNVSGYRQ